MRKTKNTFHTRPEAEYRIAELGKVGLLKPRRVCGKWFLVNNPERIVSKSQFIQALFFQHTKNKTGLKPRDIMREANSIWAELKQKGASA